MIESERRGGESKTVNRATVVVVSFGERTEEKKSRAALEGGGSRRTGSQEANGMDTQPLFQFGNKKTGRSKNEIGGRNGFSWGFGGQKGEEELEDLELVTR